MVLLSIKERYKVVLSTLFNMFISAIYSVITMLLLVIILPFIWCDRMADFFAKLLYLELYNDWED